MNQSQVLQAILATVSLISMALIVATMIFLYVCHIEMRLRKLERYPTPTEPKSAPEETA